MRAFQGLIVTAAAAALLIGGAARAEELDSASRDPVVGIGVICNTNDQAEQYINFRAGGVEMTPAVAKVNEGAHEPRACGLAAVAFVPDKTLATKTMGGKLVKIVRINVVAGYNGRGWQQVANTVQYAIVETKGEAI